MATVVRAIGPRAILGESPLWDDRSGNLTWVDVDGRQVHRWHWASELVESVTTVGRPGSIALTPDPDTLVLASEQRIGLLHWPSGEVVWKVSLPIIHPTVRLNDGRVSPSGDFWVGTMHVPASDRKFIGSLYRVHPDWTWDLVVDRVGVANGLACTPLGMQWADTLLGRCWLADDDLVAGAPMISGQGAPLIDFQSSNLAGGPDGACMDQAGGTWIACVHGSTLARFEGGTLTEQHELPVRRPTCPTFGGPDLTTMFITTIGGGGNYPVFDDEPDAGRVLVVDSQTRGVPERIFSVG